LSVTAHDLNSHGQGRKPSTGASCGYPARRSGVSLAVRMSDCPIAVPLAEHDSRRRTTW
jgi:hypothetical protein